MIRMLSISIFLLIGVNVSFINAQESKKVLFLGNSYTASNNLLDILSDLAASAGDQLSLASNAPGGYTFQGHSTNATSLDLIKQGGWDYVVLQEQSQLPSFPDGQVATQVFPYATALDEVIREFNPCAETVFFMTWGRKNGDAGNCAVWPPVCTYEGMDSLLNLRYMMMAEENEAIVSPVGAVWNRLRTLHPSIELYQADESHPSLQGSYAAACCFYTTLFQKDPSLIQSDYSLSAQEALNIRNVVKSLVYDSLSRWYIDTYQPKAEFDWNVNQPAEIQFANSSTYADSFEWKFGDGTISNEENPLHLYSAGGFYNIQLKAIKCEESDSITKTIEIVLIGIDEEMDGIQIYPNPIQDYLQLESSKLFTYRLLTSDGRLIFSGTHQSGITSMELAGESSGIYYLEIQFPEKRVIKKLLKP